MSVAIRIVRRDAFRRAPTGIESMKVCARSIAASKWLRSFAVAASINSLRIDTSEIAATRTAAATSNTGALLLDRGAARRFGAEEPGSLDELLDCRLIFSARLQQVNANGAADGHLRIRRIRIKLLQSRNELESADLARRGRLPFGARREAGAWRVR